MSGIDDWKRDVEVNLDNEFSDVSDDEDAVNMLRWLWVAAVVLILDIVTKQWVSQSLSLGESIPWLPVLDLTLLHNEGAAFSFLSQSGGWQRWFFSGIAILVSVMLIFWLSHLKKHEVWVAIAISLILGGALGNLYDRLTLGYVVDFIAFHWGTAYFPAFNIADSVITIGAIMLMVDLFKNPGQNSSEKE